MARSSDEIAIFINCRYLAESAQWIKSTRHQINAKNAYVNSSYSGVNFLPIAQLSSAIILEHWGASAQKLKTQFIEHY
jgi:hypothetical protein